MKVVLATMKDLEMVAETSAGSYRLLPGDLDAEALDAMADSYEKRSEATATGCGAWSSTPRRRSAAGRRSSTTSASSSTGSTAATATTARTRSAS